MDGGAWSAASARFWYTSAASAIIERMTGYMPDLAKVWNSTTDEQLAALCCEYPGFHDYAVLMEEAAEAERRKPAKPYDDLPELSMPI
jgi:hypothetical protein